LFQHRRSLERLVTSFQTTTDWARHLLMLVYSAWFLLKSVAVDWDSGLTDAVVDHVFNVLNRARGYIAAFPPHFCGFFSFFRPFCGFFVVVCVF
jgi:hypothetical protein